MSLPNVVEDHSFLSDELLIPNCDKLDGSRCNMVCSHLTQLLIPDNAEIPQVFTNFENQVGKYGTGYKQVKTDSMKIIKIFKFNDFRQLIVTKDSNGQYDVVEHSFAVNLTESFGYINKLSTDVLEGETLDKGSVISHNGMYDGNLNFQYGCNLSTIYLPFKGYTYEDALIISESAAQKLSHTDVSIFYVVLNRNDILANLMGTKSEYKALPDVGEQIENGILCGRRRISHSSVLDEFKDTEFNQIDQSDTNFFAHGVVTDIEVFCNTMEDLQYPYNAKFAEIERTQSELYSNFLIMTNKLVKESGATFSENFQFWKQKATDYLNEELPFSYDSTEFEGIVLKITVAQSIPCLIGSKLSGRYGNKGVISGILPDEEMPLSECGNYKVDVILNSLGVVGRMNPSQLYEHELTFIANELVLRYHQSLHLEKATKANELRCFEKFRKDVTTFYQTASPKLYEWFLSIEQEHPEILEAYLREVIENKFLPIHQPPFYGNITPDDMVKLLFSDFNVDKVKLQNVQTPVVVGNMYFIKLKHESHKKFSARSSGVTSLLDVPYKSNEKYKRGNALFNSNPVKMGEQEYYNLTLLQDESEQDNFLKAYSSSNSHRRAMLEDLVSMDVDKIESFSQPENTTTTSNSAQTVRAMFAGLGVDIFHK